MPQSAANRWVLLIHQTPPKPDYFRVKVWRRLQRLGAVAIKNSVYVLPRSDETVEDFQWQMREIVASGGGGTVCEANLLDGLAHHQNRARFCPPPGAEHPGKPGERRRLSQPRPERR